MNKNTKTATRLSLLLLPLVLASCGWGAQKPRTAEAKRSESTLFNSGKVMQNQISGKHSTRSLEEIQQLINEGKAKQIDGSESNKLAQKQEAQFQKDLLTIAQENPELANELATAGTTQNPDQTNFFEIKDKTGQTRVVALQGKEQLARQFVSASEAARDITQQRATYRMIYQAAPAAVRQQMPAPDALGSQSVEDVAEQLNSAEALLQTYYTQHPAKAEVAPLKTDLTAQGQGAGTASDITGTCNNYLDKGLIKNFAFPMREFLTSVKDQGHRGICWAFAAMGALEAVERVTADKEYNLSEQYFNAVMKYNIGDDVDRQGGNVMFSLNSFTANQTPVAFEKEWTYNGARKWRSDISFAGICNDYDGWCSETASQFPISCDPSGQYCIEEMLKLPGIPARNTSMVWYKSPKKPVPIATFKTLLNNGTPLVLSYSVYWDAMDDYNGFVSNPQPNSKAAGGHAVVIVGYVDSKDIATVLPDAPLEDEGYFIVKNSWGCDWGDSGYFYIPFSYVAATGQNVSILNDNNERSERWKTKDTKLKVTPSSKEIEINEAADFTLLRDIDNQPAKVTATWTVSDPAIAEIVSSGHNTVQVKGLKDGQVQVTATTEAGQFSATLTVKNSKLILTPSTKEIEVNEAADFTLLQEVDNQPAKVTATWTVSDPAIAEIVSMNGNSAQIKGLKDGQVQVTATTDKAQYTATVTVKAPKPQAMVCQVERVKLSTSREHLQIGSTLQLVATPEIGPAGCIGTPDVTVKWSSENTRRATVDDNGVVTALTSGYAPITATVGGKTAMALITVTR